MQNIVLVGSSGHAKVVIDIVERQARYRIVGLIDAFRKVGETTLGYAVLGSESDLLALAAEHDLKGVIVAIGEHSVVGAGSLVLSAVEAFSIAYGSPAKKVRDRQPGDRYL